MVPGSGDLLIPDHRTPAHDLRSPPAACPTTSNSPASAPRALRTPTSVPSACSPITSTLRPTDSPSHRSASISSTSRTTDTSPPLPSASPTAASSSSMLTPPQATGPHFKRLRVQREKRLPDVLSTDEVRRLIAAVRTHHNRAYFWTVYSLGLRLTEGLHLQVGDIDAARMMVHVHRGKGAKDRFVPLPSSTLIYASLKSRLASISTFTISAGFAKARGLPNV